MESIPEIKRRRLVAVEGLEEGLVGQPHRPDARRRLVHRDRVAQRDDSPGQGNIQCDPFARGKGYVDISSVSG